MGKDMVYYNLLEAVSNDNCPICTLLSKQTHQMMDSFLYESVTDRSLRKKIREARGFCNTHSSMLLQKGDPLAHAILYQDLLQLAIEDCEKKRFSKYEDRRMCPFCEQTLNSEKTYTLLFIEAFAEKEFFQAYRAGGMLCMTHLHEIYKANKAAYPQIAKETLPKYQKLIAHLQEIQRKNNYRFSNEAWGEETKNAWRRAVAVINDKSGLRK